MYNIFVLCIIHIYTIFTMSPDSSQLEQNNIRCQSRTVSEMTETVNNNVYLARASALTHRLTKYLSHILYALASRRGTARTVRGGRAGTQRCVNPCMRWADRIIPRHENKWDFQGSYRLGLIRARKWERNLRCCALERGASDFHQRLREKKKNKKSLERDYPMLSSQGNSQGTSNFPKSCMPNAHGRINKRMSQDDWHDVTMHVVAVIGFFISWHKRNLFPWV